MEYLFSVYWKNIEIGSCFIYKNKFVYIYNKEGIQETSKYGFDKLIGFPDINKIYVRDTLFPIFESRIMSKKRLTLNSIEDKINYLLLTEGKLVTDNISIKKKGIEYDQHRI